MGITQHLQRSGRRFVHKWEAVQVELQGHYSIERFTALTEFRQTTSFYRALAILPFTILPSLILVALVDVIPLEALERGLKHSALAWVRATLVCFIYTHGAIEQIRLYSPSLKLKPMTAFYISLPAAILTNALALLLSVFVCWPLPFATILMSGPWLGFTTLFLLLTRGAHLRANPEAVKEVVRFAIICGAQLTMVVVYVVFNLLFTEIPPTYQPLFALLIPAVKVLQKNILNRLLAGRDDTKPQVITLNVEVFNALFISTCMQNSQSIGTSITLISLDLLHAIVSLLDLYRMMNEAKKTMDKLKLSSNALISTAELVLRKRHAAKPSATTAEYNIWAISRTPQFAKIFLKKKQVVPTMNVRIGEYEIPIPTSRSLVSKDLSQVLPMQHVSNKKMIEAGPRRTTPNLDVLSSREHYHLLKKALQVLFLTEFMLLVEFTEVLVPVIYGGYLTILYYMPNRRFYPQLANLSEHELWNMVVSVLQYGLLELASLAILIAVLNRHVHRHSLQQLAFVLDREFLMVQPKLILWVIMTMQATLPQLGADYTFKFAWIHQSGNTTSQ